MNRLSLSVAGAVWLAVIVGFTPQHAHAQRDVYPNRPIELVVPFVAGGGADLVARLTMDYLSKAWGQPLLVVNKPGGGGVPGARAALKEAKPDGYTALVDIHTTSSLLVGAWKAPPLTLADRKYAARLIRDPMVFAVKVDAPWQDFRELSTWVKANPAQLIWATVGPAGPSRYTAYDWFGQLGVDATQTKMVITEGAADSLTKLAGGHVTLAIHSVAEAHALTEAGKIKLLAVLSPARSRYLPQVPTVEEQGGRKGIGVQWWAGIAFPSATPDAIVQKWEAVMAEMVRDRAFLEGTERVRMQVDYLNAAEMRTFVETEAAYYTDVAAKIGIRR